MKLDPYLTPYTKINSKQIKDLNVRPKPIQLLEENIGQNLPHIGLGNDFLDMTSRAQVTKAKIDKWGCIYIRNSYKSVAKIYITQFKNGQRYTVGGNVNW